jgi:hypothetical protein
MLQYFFIGGENRPFKFGFNAIDIYCRERSITLAQFTEQLERVGKGDALPGEIRDLIYAGLAGGALTSGLPLSFNSLKVGDWMDELTSEGIAAILKAFAESVSAPVKKKAETQAAKP